MATITTKQTTDRAKTPPGPKPGLIGGNVMEYAKDSIGFMMRNREEYGDVAYFRLLDYDFYQLSHPHDLKEILLTQSKKVIKSRIYKTMLSKYLGNGLLISDGAFWKRQRKLVQPAFHHKRVNAYGELMVAHTLDRIGKWDKSVDIYEEMTGLTLSIVVDAIFNVDMRTSGSEIGHLTGLMQAFVVQEQNNPIRLPDWVPTPNNRRKQRSIERLREIGLEIIQERRASGKDGGDLLSMLIMMSDADEEGMTDQQIVDEALTLILAGHDTTANLLAWTLYEILDRPEIMAQLYHEVDTVLGGRTATLEDLPNLKYTEMVLKEGLRMYPSAFAVVREALEPIELPESGYTIPAGTAINVPIYVVHHDERWFPNPETFDPERFNEENEANIPKYAYIPFIYGPRVCLGNAFAMMEARLILATVLQKYDLHLQAGQTVGFNELLTLNPDSPIMVDVRAR